MGPFSPFMLILTGVGTQIMTILETLFLQGLSKQQSLQFLILYQRAHIQSYPRAKQYEIQNLQRYFKFDNGHRSPGGLRTIQPTPEGMEILHKLEQCSPDEIRTSIGILKDNLREKQFQN